jgi:hypothetical protein
MKEKFTPSLIKNNFYVYSNPRHSKNQKYFYTLGFMRKSYFLFFLIMSVACNNVSNKEAVTSSDSTIVDSLVTGIDEAKSNETLIKLNKEILVAIKKQDYQSLANYIHPTLGVRLSPYGTISINNDAIINATELLKMMKENTKLFWGNYDGTGDPIDLSAKDYFEQFVYDEDFLNAEKVTINRSSATGNSINNISLVYPQNDYIENYFSGIDKKYEGMDWRALRLVFQKEGGKYYLIGIIHDQWTI